jgi:glutathione peroxidase
MKLYDYQVKDAKGNTVNMESFTGKVLLIVNTATGCGFTPQYKGLEELYEKYRDKGFEILDFPCNQFANQAPGTIEDIQSFCQLKYQTTFPLFAKIDVNGEQEEPLFTFLKSQQKGLLGKNIKWNFTKFLIDRNGNVIERFAPATPPEKIEEKINQLL